MEKYNKMLLHILRTLGTEKIYTIDLRSSFSNEELGMLERLYLDGSVCNTLDTVKGFERVHLTRKGKFMLFNFEHEKEIEEFGKILIGKGYDAKYLGEFLKTNNLDKPLNEIFSAEGYALFVHNLEGLQNSRPNRRIMLQNNRNIG